MNPKSLLALADYRLRVAEIYRQTRKSDLPAEARWTKFRHAKDDLFRHHLQSPIPADQRAQFQSLNYFDYNPSLRMVLPIDWDVEPASFTVELGEGLLKYSRFGKVLFQVGGHHCMLSLFWIEGYGGGIFLPFRDQTNESSTFGGGRYLLDTIKHADMGRERNLLVVDFNFAYNPSCAYDPRWVCPLAPPENWLPVEIAAGELRYDVDSINRQQFHP